MRARAPEIIGIRYYARLPVIVPASLIVSVSLEITPFFFFPPPPSLKRNVRFVSKTSRPSCRFCLFGPRWFVAYICFAKSQREDSFDDQRLNAIINLIECSVRSRNLATRNKLARYLLRSLVSNDAIDAPGGHETYYPTISNEMSRVRR